MVERSLISKYRVPFGSATLSHRLEENTEACSLRGSVTVANAAFSSLEASVGSAFYIDRTAHKDLKGQCLSTVDMSEF